MSLDPHIRRNPYGYPILERVRTKPLRHEPVAHSRGPSVVRPFLLALLVMALIKLAWHLGVLVCHGGH